MEVRSKVRSLDLKNNPVETWIPEENTETDPGKQALGRKPGYE